MEFKDVIRKRYSCRKFDGRKADPAALHRVLEAGRLAPTARNSQEQRIYVVESEKGLALIDALTPNRYNAGTVLVVAVDTTNCYTYPGDRKTSAVEDGTIVATHMILAAADEGLDSCWLNHFDPDELAKALELPEQEEIVMLMDLGYAAEGFEPTERHYLRKPLEETVSYL